MTPGLTEAHPEHLINDCATPVLRAAAIYGANASGKSNLIKAIRSMKEFVVSDRKIQSDRYYRPDDLKDEPSYFEVEIAIEKSVYSYGFEYIINKQEIVDEWLYKLNIDADNEEIFQRTNKGVNHYFEGEEKQRIDVYAEDTVEHEDRLFLNVMGRRARPAEGNAGIFNDIYDWFNDSLRFIDTEYPFSPEVLVSDSDFDRLNEIISTFGTGINSIGYSRKEGMDEIFPHDFIDVLKKSLRNKKCSNVAVNSNRYTSINGYRVSLVDDKVVFDEYIYRHNGNRVIFRPDEESEGTRRLYGILASTFMGKDRVTYIIDELDTSLHPQLTFRFVKLFLETDLSNNSQIIFTTHESSLMDFQLLRRDEIWFVEKCECGSSSIYSLEDFNERCDRRIEKAYREGRYGGLPIFSSVFSFEGCNESNNNSI